MRDTTRMKRLAIAALAATALLLTGCGSSDPAPTDDPAAAEPETPDTYTPDPAPAETDDTSTIDHLTRAGVDDKLIDQLGDIAEVNNFGSGPGIPMDRDERLRFAVVIVMVCRDVADGTATFDYYKNDDMSTGATAAQVNAVYDFAADTFCPAVKPGKD